MKILYCISFIIIILILLITTGCQSSYYKKDDSEHNLIEKKLNVNKDNGISNLLPDNEENGNLYLPPNSIYNDKGEYSSETSNVEIDYLRPDVKVIYDYADYINKKEFDNALYCLAENYRVVYGKNTNSLENINGMFINVLIDKTHSKDSSGHFVVTERQVGKVDEYSVFYAEIEYKIEGKAPGFLTNGVNYLKVITVKKDDNPHWLIAEMSGADLSWKDD